MAGRPKGSKNKTKTTPKKQTEVKKEHPKKTCTACNVEKNPFYFYVTGNPMFSDGKIPVCKDCIKSMCYDEDLDEIKLDAFKSILRQVDRPFIQRIYDASLGEYDRRHPADKNTRMDKSAIIGYYFKSISSLKQYYNMTWDEGVIYEEESHKRIPQGVIADKERSERKRALANKSESLYLDDEDFEVTDDIIRLFGEGYKSYEYKAMWKKYDFLKKNYSDVTNLHVEALLTYVRFKVKEEFATANGDVQEAKKWNEAATTAADKAKINPSQLTKSDLQGGLNSFSELLMAVEQAVDIIPILPQFKYRPNDAIDFNIWCLVNYLRDLEGKPLCEYEDVYKFYDDRKREYIEQYGDPYGIFTDDTTEANRENINKFISLPSDYRAIDEVASEEDGVLDG